MPSWLKRVRAFLRRVCYKGKENKVCKSGYCLKCDLVYYRSDFLKQKGGKFITGGVVFCGDHGNNDITSNYDQAELSENCRLITAQLKSINREEAKKQLVEDIFNQSSKKNHDTTFINSDAEVETLTVENTLLKELNQELREKCDLLKEKSENVTPKVMRTYAEITSQERARQQKIPTLIIKKTKENESIDKVSTRVTSILNKDKSIKSKFIGKMKMMN